MVIERKPTRYAHADGHTDVCYSQDGQKLISCGTDGDIRIWSGFDDDDPSQTCVGEWSLCVCQKDQQLFVGTDNNNVQIMTYPEAERDGILFRFTAHVNHMAVGRNNNFIAIGAEDMDVKLINLTDSKDVNNIKSFTGLTGPPLSVALCPKGKTLAVSSGDGFLRVWDIESGSLIKEINCVPKTNSFMNATLLCRIDFEPISGKSLAYPNNNTVVIVNTLDWSEKLILTCVEVDSPLSIVQFSPCGNLIAAASQNGDLVIWEVATKNVVDVSRHPRSISLCSLTWNPSGNGEIAFCDVQGQLGIVVNCINQPATDHVTNQAEDDSNHVDFDGFQFDDDEDDNAISLEQLKNDTLNRKTESELDFDQVSSRATTPRVIIPEIPMQSVFVVSSTPEHLNPRYLCWNEVGIIRSYKNDDVEGTKSIEVEFHDATVHNSMMLQNYQDYTMGSLSASALVVANASQVTVIPLTPGTKEWCLNLSEEAEIICIASSESLVCFATTNYMIRVCSVYGTQKAVFTIPGPLVTMAAYNNCLLIAYHSGSPRKSDQCVSIMYVKLEGFSIESKDIECALTPEAGLEWLGFSDVGTPAMKDSNGFICLYPLSYNVWVPFCDTKKYSHNPGDGFFVTAINERFQSIWGIRCRGSVYPGFTPRPTLSELPIAPPFLEIATEKTQLEANLFTWSVVRVENVEKKFKETALKTFALACKNNLDQRALEFIEMMANPQLVTLATKYATKLNKQRLAEKLAELVSSIQEDDTNETALIENSVSVSNLKPISRKLVLNATTRRSSQKKTFERGQNSTAVLMVKGNQPQSPPSNEAPENGVSMLNNKSLVDVSMDLNTQESVFADEGPKNPFLKRLKKKDTVMAIPAGLINQLAESEEEKPKDKKIKSAFNNGSSDKRKNPDSDADNQSKSNKQRKLDMFMFKKRP